jgi:hypothetical protein
MFVMNITVSGLLRRFAPRNDKAFVTASKENQEAIQWKGATEWSLLI